MKNVSDTDPIRFWEAWTVEPAGGGAREVTDECGHLHDSEAEARDHHRLHRNYNVLVAIEYDANGRMEVVREVRHNPRRPKGWGGFIFDMVNQ
jgi:hypothetical protein